MKRLLASIALCILVKLFLPEVLLIPVILIMYYINMFTSGWEDNTDV